MEKFEYIFIDDNTFDKVGFDVSKFKRINEISSFYELEKGTREFLYTKKNYVYTIEIPIGKRMVIGYYK